MSDQESDSVIMPPPKRAKIDLQEIDKGHVDESNTEYSMKPNEFSFSSSKYEDFVNPEEVEKLKEFQVLDEVKSNDEDSEEESDSSDGKSEVLPEEDIERMLDEDLPDDFKGVPKPKEKPYITRQKIVLEEKGINHFEVLPLDWMMVRHYSGMPVYMHRGTRVCTLSKPYLLGEGNTRRHYIPISAIPCLNYRRALEEEAKQQEIDRRIAEQIKNGTWQKNKTSDPSNKSSDSNRESKEVTVTVETNRTTKGVNLECNSLNSKETHNSDMKTKDDLENGDKLETSSNFVTDKQSRDNLEKNLGDTGVIEKCIPLQNNQINLEDFSNLESNKKGETVDVMSDQLNSKDNPKENNEEGALHVMDSPECSFAAKQDDQMCPVSQNNTEQNCPAIRHLQQNDVNQNDQTCSKITEAQPTRSAESENASKEQNPSEEQEEEIPLSAQPVVLPGGIVMPPPRVETVNKSWKTQQLSYEQVNDYCKKLFKFKTVNIMHFERWADRRKYAKARKTLQCPTLLEGTKLITIPAQPASGSENGGLLGSGGKAAKRDWVMNMNGRSYLSVFHEYVRRALKKQPVYEFKQLENAATPYQATVYIGGMQYGVGRGTSKRLAKANAARASIQILIPEMKDDGPAEVGEPDFSFFDYAGIEDPRITEFCAATCEPSPHATLRTCLLRNFGAGDRHIHTEMKKLEYQKIELTMKVGKHSATVVCKNKKTAKQRASQAILQALHPHVRSWGSLLRLYGSRSVKSCKEKKLEEQQITLLQDKARHNEPNHAVLHKLRLEMQRLRERDGAVVPIGMLLLKDDLPTHSGSNLNNVDL